MERAEMTHRYLKKITLLFTVLSITPKVTTTQLEANHLLAKLAQDGVHFAIIENQLPIIEKVYFRHFE